VLSPTLSTSRISLATPCMVAILVTFEALCYLELRGKSYGGIVSIIDIAVFCDTFICCMIIVEVNDNGTIFIGGFIIFAAKRSNFADGSDWKFVSSFDCLNDFGFFQIQIIYRYSADNGCVVWSVYFGSFKGFIPINGAKMF
jgi:hypothetical protein